MIHCLHHLMPRPVARLDLGLGEKALGYPIWAAICFAQAKCAFRPSFVPFAYLLVTLLSN